jgi:hypothetical protein
VVVQEFLTGATEELLIGVDAYAVFRVRLDNLE